MAVTGLVVPYERETEAQLLFEIQGGFGRGFERQRFYAPPGTTMPWYLPGTGNCGTGANMAYRRSVFTEIGGFNPALDVGTVTNGAGDLEMFLRVLAAGHVLIYEPSAIIRHRHRREYAKLKSQLTNNGSVFAYLVCAMQAYPHLRRILWKVAIWYATGYHLRRAVVASAYPNRFPKELVWAEIKGCLGGGQRYQPAVQAALALAEKFAPEVRAKEHAALFPAYFAGQPSRVKSVLPATVRTGAIAVRTIDLSQPLQAITDVTDYWSVRVFVHDRGCCRGHVEIENQYLPIAVTQLIRAMMLNLWRIFLWPDRELPNDARWQQACTLLQQHYLPSESEAAIAQPESLPAHVSVSVIVGTCDRPDDLRNCLRSLSQQETSRQFEIIVVDNNPRSGLTVPVVREFPQVRLVGETRKGVAYARNAGITASVGEVIITTDDDVTMSPTWLEKLVAPLARADVMGVTGNIVPVELESSSQQLFEHYGGLGRGYDSFEVGQAWFDRSWREVVPTWELGGTANAAFRASIFANPQIGLMAEPLGPGMPSGVGEDIYLFYKILKAGYTIVYRGDAHVWHRHRDNMPALRHQLYNYSKGFIAYNLTTCLQDGDYRSLWMIGLYLPLYHVRRIYDRLRRRSNYPIRLVLVEMAGNLMGPWALWRSWRRVKRQGRSQPYDRDAIAYAQFSRAESH
jgi:O-antigen biosynthesis protein